jgi:hypothetical protein
LSFRVRVRVSVLKNTQMIVAIVTKYFRVRIRVSVLKNTQMMLVIVTKYFRARIRVSVSFEYFSIR